MTWHTKLDSVASRIDAVAQRVTRLEGKSVHMLNPPGKTLETGARSDSDVMTIVCDTVAELDETIKHHEQQGWRVVRRYHVLGQGYKADLEKK